MHLDIVISEDGFELLVYIVQHLAINLQCLYKPFVGVLKHYHGQIRRDIAPTCESAPSMRSSEEDDQLCPFTDLL